jgi:hypothetical protein
VYSSWVTVIRRGNILEEAMPFAVVLLSSPLSLSLSLYVAGRGCLCKPRGGGQINEGEFYRGFFYHFFVRVGGKGGGGCVKDLKAPLARQAGE